MVARNRSGSRERASKCTGSNGKNHVDFNHGFSLLTHDGGMRHVGKNVKRSEEGTPMKTHGGLYQSVKGVSNQKNVSQYKPHFIKQMEKHLIKKENSRMNRLKSKSQKRSSDPKTTVTVTIDISDQDKVHEAQYKFDVVLDGKERPKVNVSRVRTTNHKRKCQKVNAHKKPATKSFSTKNSDFKINNQIDAMGRKRFEKLIKNEVSKWNQRRFKNSFSHDIQLSKLEMLNEMERTHKMQLDQLIKEKKAI